MRDPRYGFAEALNEAMDHRTQGPHDHCWHYRSYRGPHMDWVSEYQQCCRCDQTPEDAAETGEHAPQT